MHIVKRLRGNLTKGKSDDGYVIGVDPSSCFCLSWSPALTVRYFTARKGVSVCHGGSSAGNKKGVSSHCPACACVGSCSWAFSARRPSQRSTDFLWFSQAVRSARPPSGARRQCSENWLHVSAFLRGCRLPAPQTQNGKPQSQAQGAQSWSGGRPGNSV